MTYLYHYHAIAFLPDGNTQHLDGTMTCREMIATSEMFKEAREAIHVECGLPRDCKTANVTSLTLLNPPGGTS